MSFYLRNACALLLLSVPIVPTLTADLWAAEPMAATPMSPGEAAVEAAMRDVADGMLTRNNEKISSRRAYFTDDNSADHYILFDVMPPLTDPGYQNLYAKNAKWLDATVGPILMSWTDKRIVADENIATMSGILHVKFSYKDGRKIDTAMRHTMILKKIDGTFRIIHEHVSIPNDDVDMNTPGPKR